MAASTDDGRTGGCGWLLAGPVLALVITLSEAVLVSQRWADCPVGRESPTHAATWVLLSTAWLGMTVLLIVFQAALTAVLPKKLAPEVKWAVLIVATVALFILFDLVMGSPDADPGGLCYRG
ncbi:hypothetical protein ACFWP2_25855 [Kitasatospora sp. NPDC058444]|uniref:hypothetical protein n=1 Tax=Kitasatospora sp. NPDC058444 TaxID=3346504 RepID=UPI00365D5B41